MTRVGTLVMEARGAARSPEYHRPVLLDEVLGFLDPRPGGRFYDGTLGGGGMAAAILTASGPDGRLWGVDLDGEAVEHCRGELAPFGDRVRLFQGNYVRAERYVGGTRVDGAVLDLGLSSRQIDSPARGFTHREEAPLDMRFDPRSDLRADTVLNTWPEERLADLFHRYGEERHARRIARAVVRARESSPIESSTRLREIVTRSVPRDLNQKSVSRVFQALRILVNDELESLAQGLDSIFGILRVGGVLVVISYHSLEDRLVKRHFRHLASDCVCPPDFPECRCGKVRTGEILTRRPVRPSEAERAANPRARSAKLRAVRKAADA